MKRIMLLAITIMGLIFGLTNGEPGISATTAPSAWPFNASPTQTPSPVALNATFVVTEAQVRNAFDEFELKGEKGQKINLGEEHSIAVTPQGPQGPLPSKQSLLVRFLAPLDQARKFGYEFGLVARNRTAADRKAFEDLIVKRTAGHSNQAVFIVKLLPLLFASEANEPVISYVLIDRNNSSIDPDEKPDHYMASDVDLFDAVALQQDGQRLVFPVADRISNQMATMTLVVDVEGTQHKLEYKLKP